MRRSRRATGGLAAAALVVWCLTTGPARGAAPGITYETVFALPTGSSTDLALEEAYVRYIDMAVPGSRIRVATAQVERPAAMQALTRAHDRGVDVQVVMDRGTTTTALTTALRAALGPANVTICALGSTTARSCIAPQLNGTFHVRFMTLSELADGSRDVVFQPSHGMTTSLVSVYHALLVARNAPDLFAAYESYWADAKAQVKNASYYRVQPVENGTVSWYPVPADAPDPALDTLADVDCAGPGGAADGRGLLRFNQPAIFNTRLPVAQRLAALSLQGCTVEYAMSSWHQLPAATLLAGGVRVILVRDRDLFLGAKYNLYDISHRDGARERSLYLGSVEYNDLSLHVSDENQLRVDDDGVVDAFTDNFQTIRDRALWVPPPVVDATTPAFVPASAAMPTVPANAAGWHHSDVTINVAAADNWNGTGVRDITVRLSGAENRTVVIPGDRGTVQVTAEGVTTVTHSARDRRGNVEPARSMTIRLDKSAPDLSGLPEACTLWPPNHRLHRITTVTARDAGSGLVPGSPVVTASSNEADDGNGDGSADFAPDTLVEEGTVWLRAERSGTSSGRVYTVQATALDVAGNLAVAEGTCTVPHDRWEGEPPPGAP